MQGHVTDIRLEKRCTDSAALLSSSCVKFKLLLIFPVEQLMLNDCQRMIGFDMLKVLPKLVSVPVAL